LIPSSSNFNIPSAKVFTPSSIVLEPSNNCLLASLIAIVDVFNVDIPVFNNPELFERLDVPIVNFFVP